MQEIEIQNQILFYEQEIENVRAEFNRVLVIAKIGLKGVEANVVSSKI